MSFELNLELAINVLQMADDIYLALSKWHRGANRYTGGGQKYEDRKIVICAGGRLNSTFHTSVFVRFGGLWKVRTEQVLYATYEYDRNYFREYGENFLLYFRPQSTPTFSIFRAGKWIDHLAKIAPSARKMLEQRAEEHRYQMKLKEERMKERSSAFEPIDD